jgi:tetratricopeptide (TPR) repeat protein
MGDVRLAEGEAQPALVAYETALSIFERTPAAADNLADARLAVAQTLLQTGGDRTRAAELAEQARQTYASALQPDPARLRAIMEVLAGSAVEPPSG